MINYIKKKINKKIDSERMEKLLKNEDFIPIANRCTKPIKTVVIAIARMLKFSGGYTSILRLGTQLENNGFKVYYMLMSDYQSIKEAQQNAELNLKGYKGTIINKSEYESTNADAIIATFWRTVYETKHMSGYKLYFVQDYEPYFSQYGEQYILARKSYDMGYHMVSLGGWNKHMVEHECGEKPDFDVIDFPFEPSEYSMTSKDYSALKNKDSYDLAVFIKSDQKRLPNIVNSMVGNLEKEFRANGKKLNVRFFGIDKSFKVSCGENLGILNKQQLQELYRSSDFGMCASMTNVSLVPYEMLACGLPLIEFEDGTFPFFFPEGAAILTDFSYKRLYEKMMSYAENPERIEKMMSIAHGYMSNLSWVNTGRQFAEILRKAGGE